MSYIKHFALVDDVSAHFDGAVLGLDPFTKSRYAGLYAVSSAAVLELSLKQIVTEFAQKANPIFGEYVASKYVQINGRIKLSHIQEEHLRPFGTKYKDRFERLVKRIDRYSLNHKGLAVISAYGNLLTCRHKFAHEGVTTATYEDVKKGFEAGKVVMACLHKTLSAH
jgi:hypothetical protein